MRLPLLSIVGQKRPLGAYNPQNYHNRHSPDSLPRQTTHIPRPTFLGSPIGCDRVRAQVHARCRSVGAGVWVQGAGCRSVGCDGLGGLGLTAASVCSVRGARSGERAAEPLFGEFDQPRTIRPILTTHTPAPTITDHTIQECGLSGHADCIDHADHNQQSRSVGCRSRVDRIMIVGCRGIGGVTLGRECESCADCRDCEEEMAPSNCTGCISGSDIKAITALVTSWGSVGCSSCSASAASPWPHQPLHLVRSIQSEHPI